MYVLFPSYNEVKITAECVIVRHSKKQPKPTIGSINLFQNKTEDNCEYSLPLLYVIKMI